MKPTYEELEARLIRTETVLARTQELLAKALERIVQLEEQINKNSKNSSKTSLWRSESKYSGTCVSFQEGNAEIIHQPLLRSSHVVLFRLTLQHLPDPQLALEIAWQYLTQDGHILIIDACDSAKKTSHPLMCVDDALQQVAKVQQDKEKGNRRACIQLLKSLNNGASSLCDLYKIVFSNLDEHGTIVHESYRLDGINHRMLYANHSLLFLTILQRTYHISIDLYQAYNEIKDYFNDENAWTVPGIHCVVLQKKQA